MEPRGRRSSAVVTSRASAAGIELRSGARSRAGRMLLFSTQLRQPVHQLHVGVAAHLAEDGGALDRLVGDRVELAEQGDPTDFTHALRLPSFDVVDASRHAARLGVRRMLSTFMTEVVAHRAVATRPAALQPGRATRGADLPDRGGLRETSAARRRARGPGAGPRRTRKPTYCRTNARSWSDGEPVRQQLRENDPSGSGPIYDAELCAARPNRFAEHRAAADPCWPAASGATARGRSSGIQWPQNCSTRAATPDAASATPPGRRHRAPDATAGRRRSSFGKSPSASRSPRLHARPAPISAPTWRINGAFVPPVGG